MRTNRESPLGNDNSHVTAPQTFGGTSRVTLKKYMSQPSEYVAASPAPEAPARKRRPPRRVEVSRVEILSPAMRRITLTGAELEGFPPVAPASYIKLIFPEPGQTEPVRRKLHGLEKLFGKDFTGMRIGYLACHEDSFYIK